MKKDLEESIEEIRKDIEHAKDSRHALMNQLTIVVRLFENYQKWFDELRKDIKAVEDVKGEIASLKKSDEHIDKNIDRLDGSVTWMLRFSIITLAGIIANIFLTLR